jgi:ribA/ribD-fused uncharacterized protein
VVRVHSAPQKQNKMAKDRPYVVHSDIEIKGFFGDYRWLSNYHLIDIDFEGLVYPSTEHAYQAAKTNNLSIREEFLGLTCNEARLKGQEIELRPDWEDIKFSVMYKVNEIKFENEELLAMLKETGTKYLEETNDWGDTLWGICNGEGKNDLGSILMKIRFKNR